MKKFILISILFLLITNINYGQCKFKIDEYDKFKNYYKRVTVNTLMISGGSSSGSSSMECSFAIIDTNTFLIATVQKKDAVLMIADTSDELIFLNNNNNEKLILKPGGKFYGKYQSSWGGDEIMVFYLLDENKIDKLLNLKITDIRFYYSDGYLEDALPEKYLNKFRGLLTCIKNNPIPKK